MNTPIVKLEPMLQKKAASLNVYQCRELARLYERWARQLRVKALVLEAHAGPRPVKSLSRLSRTSRARD
jgi:hypothetical protein